MAAQKIKVEVDFDTLLKDISYTNKAVKRFDVSDIISRTQYYELKDALVLWMLKHNFTENTLDGLEYTIGKYGDRVELVKLTIRHGATICLLHQNLDRKTREIFNLHDTKEEDFSEYSQPEYSEISFDNQRFITSLTRMKVNRLRFLRSSLDNNAFQSTVAMNGRSQNRWMEKYINFLPLKGGIGIEITDKH